MTAEPAKRCAACAHWRSRPAGHRGDCLKSGHVSSSYRLVGASDATLIYEETKPDYWCTLFEGRAA